jgi:hypothetical protein
MSAPGVAEGDSINISVRKTQRDLKVSLGLLFIGLGLAVVWMGLVFSGVLSRNYSTQAGSVALLSVLPGMSSIFILVGAIFAGINWSMLRRQRLGPRV